MGAIPLHSAIISSPISRITSGAMSGKDVLCVIDSGLAVVRSHAEDDVSPSNRPSVVYD